MRGVDGHPVSPLSSRRQWLAQLKSATARARAAAPNGCRTDGLAKPLERIRQRIRIGRIVEQAFLPVAHDVRQTLDARRHDRKPRRHVLENLQRRPVKLVRQRRMGRDVEWRHADVGGCEDRRNVFVRHGTNECNAVETGGCVSHTGQLRTVADEHRLDVVSAARAKASNRVDQVDRAVPRAKGTRKDRNDIAVAARERHSSGLRRDGSVRIGSPFGAQDLRRRDIVPG